MYAQVEKPKENKSRTVANSIAQKKSNGQQGYGFVDNRTEGIAQRKIQALIIKSPAETLQKHGWGTTMQLARQVIKSGDPNAISLDSLQAHKVAIDTELADPEYQDEVKNGFVNNARITTWLAQYDKRITKLESMNPGDTTQTFEEVKSSVTELQKAMLPVVATLANLRGALNKSLSEYKSWKDSKDEDAAAKALLDKELAGFENKEPRRKEPKKTPTKHGANAFDKKWGDYNKPLAALAGNTKFLQLVPANSKTVEMALKSQNILDAVYHKGKAFWVTAENSDYRLAASSGKVLMIYTFSSAGAKSLMQDALLCGSGDYAEDNEEEWLGEAYHPDYTIWKTNEIGAFGIGANRLAALASSCEKIEVKK